MICDVPVPKDTPVYLNIASQHFNPKVWHNPEKFIPERFDPESEYYNIPGTDEQRLLSSFMPFSFGKRRCPGENYAFLALKTMVAYFIIRCEYKCDSVYDKNYYIGLEGRQNLYGAITKKYS
mmetsp:Transcript_14154/g.12492  ORF Transcript_14154/g.12492 Transcript_14154/m.12492 type:complete len:122 (-) Transcript_14154:15-380(-)